MKIFQFEIWSVNLNPTKGSEQKGIRPCLVLQTNASNNYGFTTIVAPLTSKKLDKVYPYEVKIKKSKVNGLTLALKINFSQIRVIDKKRLVKKIGVVEKEYFTELKKAINIIFDLVGDFN